jgi:hypothetical protein
MLKLNVNQEKQLTFEVQIAGVQSDSVSSHLRIVIDEIEYGFPATVGNESIVVTLPPLRSVTARQLKEGEEVEVKLEIIADGNYLTPWTDSFRLSNPLMVEAKIMNSEFDKSPAFRTKLVQEGTTGDRKQGVRIEKEIIEENEEYDAVQAVKDNSDELTDKLVEKLSEKFASIIGSKQEKVKPVKEEKEEEEEETKDQEEVQENEPAMSQGQMDKILAQTISKLGLHTEDSRTTKKKKELTLEQFKKTLTKEDVFKYMERAGAKNPKIQEIVYEQAVLAAKDSTPVEVLRQVITIMKKRKKS